MERVPHPFGARRQVQPKGNVPVNESDEVLPVNQTDDAWSAQEVRMLIAGGLEKGTFFGSGIRHCGHFLLQKPGAGFRAGKAI